MGKLDRVRPNARHQQALLKLAGENIAGAQRASPVSLSLALTGAYDAARHCVDAHLNANGLRAKSGDGAHRFRVEYARVAMREILSAHDIESYRVARQIRNATEYPSPEGSVRLQNSDVQDAINLAKVLYSAVGKYLSEIAP